jgi:hydroxymethylpyrimidine pyrophosphatase-like HAD family hydrolase
MDYQMLVLDLDGTLTNSRKELTEPTKQALIEIQEEGKKVVLASGRPINGIVPLAEKLNLSKYGGYMLSFNGARITQCSTGEIIYNRTLPADVIAPIYEITSTYPGLDILTYDGNQILSGIASNEYTEKESFINNGNRTGTGFRIPTDFPCQQTVDCRRTVYLGRTDAAPPAEVS